ncbi:MAG: RsbRD N-terminal domain-containing protein [Pseudomonadota bacterium]
MGKSLFTLLADNKPAIFRKWFDLVANTYPPDTAALLKNKKDAFANPVGQATRTGLDGLLEAVLGEVDPDVVTKHLDPILRIRAVQDFSPSRAIAFVLDLKNIVKNHFTAQLADPELLVEYIDFATRVDRLALIGFDIYVACREQIYMLKVTTEKDKIYKAFHRAGLIVDDPDS